MTEAPTPSSHLEKLEFRALTKDVGDSAPMIFWESLPYPAA